MKKDPDFELLDDLLHNHSKRLEDYNERVFKAFSEWHASKAANPRFMLTGPQRAWLNGVAERIDVIAAASAENVFSQLSPKRQAEQRERAAAVRMPWEGDQGEVTRYLVGQTEGGGFVVREVQARFVEVDGKRGYVCKVRSSGRSVQVEFVPEDKVYESAMAALQRKKELEKSCRSK